MVFRQKQEGGIKVSAWQAGKNWFIDFFEKYPELKSSAITNWLFGTIFVLVVIWGIFRVPWSQLFVLSGTLDAVVSVGLPWAFFVIDLANPAKMPIYFWALIGDLALYLVFSYLVDILIMFTLKKIRESKPASVKEYKMRK